MDTSPWWQPLSRRRLLRDAGMLALGGASLSGCSSALVAGAAGVGPSKRTLTYWNLFSGGDGVRMVAMQQGYTKRHQNVDLNATTLAWGNPYYTKVELATLGNRPPDVAISHLSRVPTLAKAGLLEPLDPALLARHGMTADRFTPHAWQQAHVNGKLYAVPLDTHPFVLYYNTEVCKKAGLLDTHGQLKPLNDPKAFADALAAAKKVTGAWGGVISLENDPAMSWRWFATLYWQAGGKLLADDGRRVVLDDDKAAKVLDYIGSLSVKRNLMPRAADDPGTLQMFSTGKAGFLLDGEWEVTTYQAAKTPFDMTLIPNLFGGPYVCEADSHTFVLPRDAKRTPLRRSLDLDFIRFLLGESLTWAKGGHIPAWLPVQRSAAYRSLEPQSHYVDAAYHAHYDPPAWFSGSGADLEIVVGETSAAVAAGQLSTAQAVRRIRAKLSHYAHTPPPVG